MKLASMLAIATAVALAASSVDRVAAVECTQTDAEKLLTLTSKIEADKDCMEGKDASTKCPNAKCVGTLKKVAKEMPDCRVDGRNVKDDFTLLVLDCSAATRSTAVSAAVALASTVLAVAMVAL